MTAITAEHTQQQAFTRSWWKLLDSGEKIIALCDARRWTQARQLLAARENLSQQHFQRFPVGPATKQFYHQRIAHLFDLEQSLTALQTQHAQHLSARPRPKLSLIQ